MIDLRNFEDKTIVIDGKTHFVDNVYGFINLGDSIVAVIRTFDLDDKKTWFAYSAVEGEVVDDLREAVSNSNDGDDIQVLFQEVIRPYAVVKYEDGGWEVTRTLPRTLYSDSARSLSEWERKYEFVSQLVGNKEADVIFEREYERWENLLVVALAESYKASGGELLMSVNEQEYRRAVINQAEKLSKEFINSGDAEYFLLTDYDKDEKNIWVINRNIEGLEDMFVRVHDLVEMHKD